jgi:hypothetical protein
MTECNQETFAFTAHFSRWVEAGFTAGQVSTDGGALLLREVDHTRNVFSPLPQTTRGPSGISGFRRNGKSGPSRQKKTTPQSKPLRLDAHKQGALVQARLAANDMVVALKSGGDWQTAMVKYDKVAVTPAKLNSYVDTLSLECDWKQVLVELMAVLEQFGDRLPLAVLSKKRTIEKLLDGKDLPLAAREVPQHPAKRYQKPKKVDSEGSPARPHPRHTGFVPNEPGIGWSLRIEHRAPECSEPCSAR